MTGRTISHYRIAGKLGEGGMGSVWKAEDTRLGRPVALKFLRQEFTERFEREARAIAALNHPNVCTLYDVGVHEGEPYLVMEYVEGKPLKGPLPLNDALKAAIQITAGMAAAHAKGIVHRDLKLTNVMVNEAGHVKVLDFGLAKLVENRDAPEEETLTLRAETEEGRIVGTVAYMSPEQAQGKKVDARSDIFSFGSLLYELMTGRQAFQGESRMSVLAAIINKEPKPVTGVVPTELERIINKCLRKDPARRYQHIDDVKSVLEDLKEESESGKLAAYEAPAKRRTSSVWMWLGGAAVLIGAAAAGVVLWRQSSAPAAIEFQTERFTTDPGFTMMPTVTRDGTLAAYASDRSGEGHLDIWLHHIESGQTRRLTRHEAEDYAPSIAPDGSRVVFRSEREGGGVYAVEALTGVERKLAPGGTSPAYSPDGTRIAFVREGVSPMPGGRLFVMDARTLEEREVTPEVRVACPATIPTFAWSEDGKSLVFEGSRRDELSPGTDFWVVPADGGAATGLRSAARLHWSVPLVSPVVWHGGRVYYFMGSLVEGTHLYRVPLAENPWRISGTPERLTSGAGVHLSAAAVGAERLLFTVGSIAQDLVSVPLAAGGMAASGPAVNLTTDSTMKAGASVAGDGKTLAYAAFVSWERAVAEIRLKNLENGAESIYESGRLLPFVFPVLSRDGTRIAYTGLDAGVPASFAGAVDSPPGKKVCEKCQILGFFAQPRHVLVRYGALRLARRDLESGIETELLSAGSRYIAYANVSPDDRWLVVTDVTGNEESRSWIVPVRDQPVPEKEWIRLGIPTMQHWQVSALQGLVLNARPSGPVWSADGNALYFVNDSDGHMCIWTQRLHPGTKMPVGAPVAVHHLHRPGTSQAWFGRAQFVVAAPGRLIVPVWSGTSNLWLGKIVRK